MQAHCRGLDLTLRPAIVSRLATVAALGPPTDSIALPNADRIAEVK